MENIKSESSNTHQTKERHETKRNAAAKGCLRPSLVCAGAASCTLSTKGIPRIGEEGLPHTQAAQSGQNHKQHASGQDSLNVNPRWQDEWHRMPLQQHNTQGER
eukprot:1161752-Pelagomonas_calceolata.AAC.8